MSRIKRQPEVSTAPAPVGMSQDMEPVHIDLSAAAGVETPTRVEPSPRFMLCWHPERWQVLAGRLVPACGKIKLMRGLENCEYIEPRGGGQGRWSIRAAVMSWEARGYRAIPLDVDGPGSTYVYSPRGRPDVALTRWERVYSGSTMVDSDVDGYAKWLESLIKRGIIDPCPAYVVNKLLQAARKEYGEIADRVHAVPSLQGRLTQLEKDIAVLEAAHEVAPRNAAPVQGEAVASLE